MPPVHFDWTISLGQIVTTGFFVLSVLLSGQRLYHLLDLRITQVCDRVDQHGATLVEHKDRLKRYEETLFEAVGDLQRLVGRAEVQLHDRRQHR